MKLVQALLEKVKSDVKLTRKRKEALELLLEERINTILDFLRKVQTPDKIELYVDRDRNIWLLCEKTGVWLGNLRDALRKLRVIERNIPITNVDTPDRYRKIDEDTEIIEDEVVEDPF